MSIKKIKPPWFPIIYVRGYAMSQGEIDATVSTPYMGFNLGATKVRMNADLKVVKHIFESPLVRLMKKHKYKDVFDGGREIEGNIPSKSIIIFRYYEGADSDLGNKNGAPSIIEAAGKLSELVLKVRKQVCEGDAANLEKFRVYLVAHSMGGLVCRCFLQNGRVGSDEAKKLVDKVFTYATPHNGIEMAGMNVPKSLGLWDMNNFNRKNIADFLDLESSKRVDGLDGKFDPNRFFCFVGTNRRDYSVAMGLSKRLAGERSDGLVKIRNATVRGGPRAFAYRSHSGPFGIVNSEEGYQNLVRFLFGDVRVDGLLEVEHLPLPPSVKRAKNKGKEIRASYYFESSVSPRGGMIYKLTERRKETFCAVVRGYDEMIHPERVGQTKPRHPFLFSIFLNDSKQLKAGKSLIFSVDLSVSTTGYEIDGLWIFDKEIPGEVLYRATLSIRATRSPDDWQVTYANADEEWGEKPRTKASLEDGCFYIPISSKKGFKARLKLRPSLWNHDPMPHA